MIIDFNRIQSFFRSSGAFNIIKINEAKAARLVRFFVNHDLNVFECAEFSKQIFEITVTRVL